MKISALVCALILVLPVIVAAEMTKQEAASTSDAETEFEQVRVSMQRLLKSTNGEYFLSLYAGVWNPSATLTRVDHKQVIAFKGQQKANDLTLDAVNLQETYQGIVQIKGELNANSGVFKSTLIDHDGRIVTRRFEPAFKVTNKPLFIFKFYGTPVPTHKFGKLLTRVDVLDKNNNQLVQTLTGFQAFPNSIGYMDVNFDGYYDVVLSDLSGDKTLEDRRFIYWMYNPKTRQFQHSSQLDQIPGFPTLYGERQEIDFSNGRVFKVVDGILHPLEQATVTENTESQTEAKAVEQVEPTMAKEKSIEKPVLNEQPVETPTAIELEAPKSGNGATAELNKVPNAVEQPAHEQTSPSIAEPSIIGKTLR